MNYDADRTSRVPTKSGLYRITTDIREETNLADKETKRVEALKKKLDDWWPGRG